MKQGTKPSPKSPSPERPKIGRPSIGEPVRIRMSDTMLEQLQAQAAEHGMNVSEYVRALILADLKGGK